MIRPNVHNTFIDSSSLSIKSTSIFEVWVICLKKQVIFWGNSLIFFDFLVRHLVFFADTKNTPKRHKKTRRRHRKTPKDTKRTQRNTKKTRKGHEKDTVPSWNTHTERKSVPLSQVQVLIKIFKSLICSILKRWGVFNEQYLTHLAYTLLRIFLYCNSLIFAISIIYQIITHLHNFPWLILLLYYVPPKNKNRVVSCHSATRSAFLLLVCYCTFTKSIISILLSVCYLNSCAFIRVRGRENYHWNK